MSKFVHLHCHSEYSLLDGLPKIKKMVKTAKELGMEAIALTDHGVMHGAIEFYKEAQKEGIKPIIGMEGYTTKFDHKKKDGRENTDNKSHYLQKTIPDIKT
jgi:DNA polymerase III subunit alpha